MAASGYFTYEDLYAVNSPSHNYKPISQLPSSFISNQHLSKLNISTTTIIIPRSKLSDLISSTEEIEFNTELNKFPEVIPFAYFYWLLVVLAIFLTLTLITVFICYCRTFLKNYRTRRASLPSFHRYRTVNRRTYTQNIHQPSAPPHNSLPTPPCPSKSLASLNTQLHRQTLDLGISPQISRHDVYQNEPLRTFTNSSSNLSSALQSQSSDLPLNIELSYESQRASMALIDEFKNDVSMIDNH